MAVDAGLEAIAITDHDATAGIGPARDAAPPGLDVLTGSELTCYVGSREAHILAYGFDPSDQRFAAALEACAAGREERAAKMADKLRGLGVDVSLDDIRRAAGEGTIARPHVAMAIVARGHAQDIDDAFRRFIGRGGAAFVEKPRMEPVELFDTVRSAGGVSVLAHPGTFRRDDLIPVLVDAGLDGIEVRHTDHPAAVMRHYERMAESMGLLMTGGSDFHGLPGHRGQLGSPEVPTEWFDLLVARVRGRG